MRASLKGSRWPSRLRTRNLSLSGVAAVGSRSNWVWLSFKVIVGFSAVAAIDKKDGRRHFA